VQYVLLSVLWLKPASTVIQNSRSSEHSNKLQAKAKDSSVGQQQGQSIQASSLGHSPPRLCLDVVVKKVGSNIVVYRSTFRLFVVIVVLSWFN